MGSTWANMFNPCDQLDDILVNLDDFLPIWNPKNTNAKRCFQELVSTVFSSIEDDKVYHISQASFYVGPVRNSTPWNYLSALPIVQLAPSVTRMFTVDELAEAWGFYVMKEEFEILEKPTYLLYNQKKISLGQNIKVLDVIDQNMKKHYFCLPQLKWN